MSAPLSSVLTPERLASAYTYASYRQLIDELMAQNLTTGTNQTEQILQYARLNVQRMRRVDKTIVLLPELHEALANLQNKLRVAHAHGRLVRRRGPDCARNRSHCASQQRQVESRYLLRDENLDLMDRYLTDGGRSIPKLIVLHADTLTEAATWGPRPCLPRPCFAS